MRGFRRSSVGSRNQGEQARRGSLLQVPGLAKPHRCSTTLPPKNKTPHSCLISKLAQAALHRPACCAAAAASPASASAFTAGAQAEQEGRQGQEQWQGHGELAEVLRQQAEVEARRQAARAARERELLGMQLAYARQHMAACEWGIVPRGAARRLDGERLYMPESVAAALQALEGGPSAWVGALSLATAWGRIPASHLGARTPECFSGAKWKGKAGLASRT
jgi:hypothetical protein